MTENAADEDSLPDYATQLEAFHRAFGTDLRAVIAGLPLAPEMRVLDVGCGDGFYTRLLAERLTPAGSVVGLDMSAEYLQVAQRRLEGLNDCGQVNWVVGKLSQMPVEADSFDLVWCAQSLYSLPEPVAALRQMAAAARPGGVIAVLENDTLHQVMLPWPGSLEIALRAAEFAALSDESRRPGKYYLGHRLPAAFAEAGIEPLGFRTQCIDRQTPLDDDLQRFLLSYLERLAERVQPYLTGPLAEQFASCIDPRSKNYLLHRPWFTMSYMNIIAWGRRPKA